MKPGGFISRAITPRPSFFSSVINSWNSTSGAFIRLTKGKTNRQYLREVGARISLRQLVEQTMIAFEDAFFGRHPLDQTRFESCWFRLGEFDKLNAEGYEKYEV